MIVFIHFVLFRRKSPISPKRQYIWWKCVYPQHCLICDSADLFNFHFVNLFSDNFSGAALRIWNSNSECSNHNGQKCKKNDEFHFELISVVSSQSRAKQEAIWIEDTDCMFIYTTNEISIVTSIDRCKTCFIIT